MSTNWKKLRKERRENKGTGYTRPVPEGWTPSTDSNGGAHPPQGTPLPGIPELDLPKHDWLIDD